MGALRPPTGSRTRSVRPRPESGGRSPQSTHERLRGQPGGCLPFAEGSAASGDFEAGSPACTRVAWRERGPGNRQPDRLRVTDPGPQRPRGRRPPASLMLFPGAALLQRVVLPFRPQQLICHCPLTAEEAEVAKRKALSPATWQLSAELALGCGRAPYRLHPPWGAPRPRPAPRRPLAPHLQNFVPTVATVANSHRRWRCAEQAVTRPFWREGGALTHFADEEHAPRESGDCHAHRVISASSCFLIRHCRGGSLRPSPTL